MKKCWGCVTCGSLESEVKEWNMIAKNKSPNLERLCCVVSFGTSFSSLFLSIYLISPQWRAH